MENVLVNTPVPAPAKSYPKLSALIRKGAKKVPQQCYGSWFKYEPVTRKLSAACSIGAAAAAIGVTRYVGSFNRLLTALGWTMADQPYVAYPEGVPVWDFALNRYHMNIFEAIASLNDCARWKREQVADWLESVGY